jgi:hypothetical protein
VLFCFIRIKFATNLLKMVLKDILAVSGEPGLFKFIAQGKNSIIVEHLETKKRSSVYGSTKVSSLEDIAIFTEEEDVPLGKVLDIIYDKANGGAVIDPKSEANLLKAWFEEILPGYARDKVYVSDIKKIANWYNILHKLNMLVKEEPETVDDTKETVDPESQPVNQTGSESETTPASGKQKTASKSGKK